MSKSNKSSTGSSTAGSVLGDVLKDKSTSWVPLLSAVEERFDAEYEGKSFELPEEVEAMPVFRDWGSRLLAGSRCLSVLGDSTA